MALKNEDLEKIFEHNFLTIMIRKDIKAFKRDYPTLYRVIMKSMSDVKNLKL